jgi:hypothetical protein
VISNDPRGQLVEDYELSSYHLSDHGPRALVRTRQGHSSNRGAYCVMLISGWSSGRTVSGCRLFLSLIKGTQQTGVLIVGCSSQDAHQDELNYSGRGVHHGMYITTTACHSADIGVARVPTKHWGVVGRGWSLSLFSLIHGGGGALQP